MSTQATINSETNSRMSAALETAGKIAEVGVDFRLLKKRLANAVDDAVLEAERIAKHGKRAMEDVKEDTTYWIRRIRGKRSDTSRAPHSALGCV